MSLHSREKKKIGKYYAVRKGFKKGIFDNWNEVSGYVKNYPGAQHKSFKTFQEAENYISSHSNETLKSQIISKQPLAKSLRKQFDISELTIDKDNIYCASNHYMHKGPFYAVEDNLEGKKFIFVKWNEVQEYMSWRKLQRRGSSSKSPVNFKKFNTFAECKSYFTKEYNELEEAYLKKLKTRPIYIEAGQDALVIKLTVYCDGSGAYNSMGYGVYFDIQSTNNEHCLNFSSLKSIYGTPPFLEKLNRSTNNVAELYAFKKALEKIELFYHNNIGKNCVLDVTVITDSNYTLNAVQMYVKNKHDNLQSDIPNEKYIQLAVKHYLLLKKLYSQQGISKMFNLKWTAGHAGTKGNEIADQLADMGAQAYNHQEEVKYLS
ncbi:hypothetical protein QEN19_000492 [Hanseniaspora menglaensis]